jgi:hypothetical protein
MKGGVSPVRGYGIQNGAVMNFPVHRVEVRPLPRINAKLLRAVGPEVVLLQGRGIVLMQGF